MDEQLSSTTNLTIYDSTPISGKVAPGDEWATLSLGVSGLFAHSNSELIFARDALEKFLTEGKILLDILDRPDPDDEPAISTTGKNTFPAAHNERLGQPHEDQTGNLRRFLSRQMASRHLSRRQRRR
ncbi:hypothetical protein [Amycolatopsis sp. H20-H5]|uniref:hypothetical protein n=1 Tax=Amycolatopsis sp. H20-H5 TaxID=3046309 RepID=UPI002DBF1A7A|nr:hypothetical protein [Amycolatopsis sp. H20-H5]MEC3977186.1 hypothetical protein [Amycolatopsis sp. H20-H5]